MKETPLRFKNGKFKILHITDTQEIPAVSPDTLKLINKALDMTNPDLVIFTGDQIKGYGITFKGKNFAEKVKSTLDILLEPVVSRGIPFAVTFGNHDSQAGMTAEEQWKHYKSYDLCLGEDAKEADGCGTFNLPVMSGDGENIAMNIYVIDSHGDAKGGGYEPVDPSQIEWYRKKRDELAGQNGGKVVPSVAFQHIPCHEYYNVLKRVSKHTKGAVRAYRTHKNEYYLLDEEKMRHTGIFLEPPSIPDIDTGEFKAMREKNDVFAMYVGHDHSNSFVGTYDGVDLGYTPGCGFNVYGPGVERGVRVLEFNEENPREYTTQVLSFKNIIGTKVDKPLLDFIFSHQPTTVDMAIAMIVKALLWLVGAGVALAVIIKLLTTLL